MNHAHSPLPDRAAKAPCAPGGVLTRLRHDIRGNTLAIAAASIIPLAAFSGSAIDMARLYVVKVRLQQACDAGVLAGRKFMADDGNATLDNNAKTQAGLFFKNNFKEGWFMTKTPVFTPTKTLVDSTYQVSGTATVQVPMSIMAMFGFTPSTLSVACQARFDTPDTDVMFVLDTTGSMACLPSDSETACGAYVNTAAASSISNTYVVDGSTGYYVKEKNGSRIESLRQAVLTFYDTVAAGVDPTTHVRYAFVTYTSTVNAGKEVYGKSSSYFVPNWTYQSRQVKTDYIASFSTAAYSDATAALCSARAVARSPSTLYTYDSSSGTATDKTTSYVSLTKTCTVTTHVFKPVWAYQPVNYDVSGYLATINSSGATVTDPSNVLLADTSRWKGCIEERYTAPGATSFNQSALPADLNPDLVPNSTDTKWRPMWPDVEYDRNGTPNETTNGDDIGKNAKHNPYSNEYQAYGGAMTCGKPVKRLFVPTTRDDIYNYVYATDFKAIGGTYHDTGMIWGTRLLSPNGIFKTDTAAWPNRKPPHRMIVFMTDGDMKPSSQIYGMYGVELWDRRVSGSTFGTGDPSDGSGSPSNQDKYKAMHNARFLAECQKAKSEGIDVWVVALGQGLTSELTTCATVPQQALYADSTDTLKDAFKTIANQVAMLRISQ